MRVGATGQDRIEIFQSKPDIGKDRKVDDLIFVELGCIHIDVNDGGLFCEFGDFAGDAVVKADSEGKEEITIIDCVVGVDGSVHAEPFERLRIGFRKTANTHQSGGDRDSGAPGEFEEIGFSLRGDDSAPDIKNGAVGFFDEAQDFIESYFVWRGCGAKSGNIHGSGPRDLGGSLLNVFRDVDNDGAGATAGSDVEGLRDDTRDISGIHDQVAVFDDGKSDSENVGLLEGASPDGGGGDLASDGNHGDGVHESVGDTGD
jgi:hypothetical protein